jgi:L-threonylcarbamoyladenylate synthase
VPPVLPIDADKPDPETIAEAASVFARGGLVAFPTETVYGLGARGLHPDEVARIFDAKRRPTGHPLILHVDGEAMAASLASSWSSRASALCRAFWPGPLTLVVPRASHVPPEVTGGLDAVGLRCPNHPVALALIAAVGEPLAAPSANAHMHISPTAAGHVVRSLGDRVDLVLDAGPTAHGIESTVIDLAHGTPRVLRPGALSLAALRSVVPDLVYEAVTVTGDEARLSPGLAAKHYAPRARVVLVAGPDDLASEVSRATSAGLRVGVLAWSLEARARLRAPTAAPAPNLVLRILPEDAEAYAHELFAALHAVDEAGCDTVVIERVPAGQAWWAVADRLRRAAQEA